MKGLFLIMLTILFSTFTLAQEKKSYAVSGKVSGPVGPLSFALVVIDSLGLSTSTNIDGRFVLKNVPAGEHKISAQMMGFNKQVKTIKIQKKSLSGINFNLQESAFDLDGVTITAETEKEKLEKTAEAVDVIETKEAKLQTADMGEVMAQTEGISIRRSGGLGSGTRFSLNGLTDDQIRFFLDGVPLEYTEYAFGIANVPVNLIDRIEVYKGVVPIRFGADALGGAVNLVSPKVFPGFSGSASYQTGSFGTHRVATNINYLDDSTGIFIGGGGFYDYSKNNYKVEVPVEIFREDGTPTGKTRPEDLPRFHDTYRARGVNFSVGLKNRKWADELIVKGFYADYDKEIQHNQIMAGIPYGDVRGLQKTIGTNLAYRKGFNEKVDVEILAGFNYSERQFIDTGHCAYNWYGECILVKNKPGEVGGVLDKASHQYTWDRHYFARFNSGYRIAEGHTVRLTIAPTYTFRTGDELLEGTNDPLTGRGELLSWVNGLEYTLDAFGGKLQNIAFVKSYFQGMEAEKDVPKAPEPLITKRNVSYYGYGNGMRYNFTNRFSTKLSYEYAIRLPRQDQVFGDGQFIIKNFELMPERSHNANLEFRYSNKMKSLSHWRIQSTFFLRMINDFIRLEPDVNRASQYRNVHGANSLGVELSGKWTGLKDKISIGLNTTYQDFYNSSLKGSYQNNYGERIPNAPYYFANGSASYTFFNTIKNQDKLILFWTGRYVHSFYRFWESGGARYRELKEFIPSQFINNAGVTYKLPLKKLRWALTAEMQNLTNEKVFDFLGVQRPGRAFYVKLTTQF